MSVPTYRIQLIFSQNINKMSLNIGRTVLCIETLYDVTDPMNVYCGGACLERPKIRISQMAASVESLGMNLMHNLLFLNAGSSGERKRGTGHVEESEREMEFTIEREKRQNEVSAGIKRGSFHTID